MTSRNWLITGVSSGFGRELATQLLDRGDTVVGTVRRPDSVADLLQKYPDTFHRELLDVTDADAVREVVDRSFRSLGRIDVVVSNAGYGLFGAAEELSDEQVGQIIATNLTGSIQLIRASLPHLRAQGGGRIIQISSYGGQVALPGNSLYHATKWGIEGFAESVAHEVAPFGIGVTIVEPGAPGPSSAMAAPRWLTSSPRTTATRRTPSWPCSTQPTDSPSATRPGWPPPSSPARTSSPRRCASSSDRRRCRLPSPGSRNASPALRHRRPWLPQPTSRPANSQNPVRLVAGLAA
jgi:NAD(P)-dependent dehydrogenase (short-subunit alcohol dehydrogenase family)